MRLTGLKQTYPDQRSVQCNHLSDSLQTDTVHSQSLVVFPVIIIKYNEVKTLTFLIPDRLARPPPAPSRGTSNWLLLPWWQREVEQIVHVEDLICCHLGKVLLSGFDPDRARGTGHWGSCQVHERAPQALIMS